MNESYEWSVYYAGNQPLSIPLKLALFAGTSPTSPSQILGRWSQNQRETSHGGVQEKRRQSYKAFQFFFKNNLKTI